MSTHPLVNQYTGRTAETPRPARDQPEWANKVEEVIVEAQGLWDEAKARDDALAPHRETIEKRLGFRLTSSSGRAAAVHDQQRRYRIEESILAEEAAVEASSDQAA